MNCRRPRKRTGIEERLEDLGSEMTVGVDGHNLGLVIPRRVPSDVDGRLGVGVVCKKGRTRGQLIAPQVKVRLIAAAVQQLRERGSRRASLR
jgi:hypothetical protein